MPLSLHMFVRSCWILTYILPNERTTFISLRDITIPRYIATIVNITERLQVKNKKWYFTQWKNIYFTAWCRNIMVHCHNCKYHWASASQKLVPSLNVSLAQTKLKNLWNKQNNYIYYVTSDVFPDWLTSLVLMFFDKALYSPRTM